MLMQNIKRVIFITLYGHILLKKLPRTGRRTKSNPKKMILKPSMIFNEIDVTSGMNALKKTKGMA